MAKVIRVGLLGCGVVGGGVIDALHQNRAHIEARDDIRFEVVKVAVRDVLRHRTKRLETKLLSQDWREVCENPDVDIVVEVMGGIEPARTAILTALENGKHVVTANKAVLAHHGAELTQCAKRVGKSLLFEGSVLGGIPALHLLDSYFCANRILRISGILNGTCNYILNQMAESDLSFAEALQMAQEAGFAEADPTQDIEAFDTLYKLQILSRLALNSSFTLEEIERIGIEEIDSSAISFVTDLGCQIKLLGQIERVSVEETDESGFRAFVAPVVVSNEHPLSAVRGVQNALCVEADIVGQIILAGPGAGAFPTASSVVEDLVKVVKGQTRELTWRDVNVHDSEHEAYLVLRSYGEGGTKPLGGTGLERTLAGDVFDVYYHNIPEKQTEGWIVKAHIPVSRQRLQGQFRVLGDLARNARIYPFHFWTENIVDRCTYYPCDVVV